MGCSDKPHCLKAAPPEPGPVVREVPVGRAVLAEQGALEVRADFYRPCCRFLPMRLVGRKAQALCL